jgi:transposase
MDASDTALHGQNTTAGHRLYMALELGEKRWKLSLGGWPARAQPLYGRRRGHHRGSRRRGERKGALPSRRRRTGLHML